MSDAVSENELCQQVAENLPEVLAGEASAELLDHVGDCDRCRDARHEAELAAGLVMDAGKDYRHPEDFEARLAAGLTEVDDPPTDVLAAEDAPEGKTTSTEGPSTERMPDASQDTSASSEDAGAAPDGKPVVSPTSATDTGFMSWLRRPRNTAKVALLGAAATVALVALGVGRDEHGQDDTSGGSASVEHAWQGKVVRLSRAAGGEGGLEICREDACAPAEKGATIAPGSLLRTDGRTRVELSLADGTRISLDRSTELKLDGASDRRGALRRGAIVADVAKLAGSQARFDLPRGYLEVLGTKFALRATDKGSTVDVSRGSVRLVDAQERSVKVRAGEEGRSYPGVAPYASFAPALGETLSWSESIAEEGTSVRGLGELIAKKPGSDEERRGAVRLSSHKVKVRIVDGFARTEIEEVFSNSADEVLEGIYRFPLPPDAQIERLALETNGKLEEGAFVDRDRAAAIWRGAIVNAAPRKRRPRDEIIWVPGPWKDPALLEWQRGGRFELRIFPIPKRGSRRIVLSYTQVIKSVGGMRRYIYPLAHDASGTLRVDDFQIDLQLRGHDPERGVSSQGYALQRGNVGEAQTLNMSAKGFVPSGDLVVEYAAAGADQELSAWAYQSTGAEDAKSPSTPGRRKLSKPAAKAIAAVTAPTRYAALALRPKLPRREQDDQRAYVLVVDSSRSMYGERYRRASAVASRLVAELDRLDRFTLLACHSTCRALPGALQVPSYEAAREVDRFLNDITPEGGSDPAAALRAAGVAGREAEGRSVRVIYIGDGTPTVGPIRPADLEEAARDALPAGRGSLTAVAIGADGDLTALGALAKGGGGAVLPYVPGQTTAEATYAILGASYGMGLRDVTVELPEGLVEVAPRRTDNLLAGGEMMLVARMQRPEVSGTVVLRGKVGDKPFEQRYPLNLRAESSSRHAFVPRLYAAARIADLEHDGSAAARVEAVALSGAFNVASRYTSLLVLESPAMFRAFGLDNKRRVAEWTGEQSLLANRSRGQLEVPGADRAQNEKKESRDLGFDFGSGSGSSGASSGLGDSMSGDDKDLEMSRPMPTSRRPMAPPAARSRRTAKPKSRPKSQMACRPGDPLCGSETTIAPPPRRRPPRQMVPMRRIWERRGTISTNRLVPLKAASDKVLTAESELGKDDNRRASVKQLYALYALGGQVDRAANLAERWSERSALDPAALTARADVAARRGQRDDAIRILGSVVDVRPGDIAAQQRLARLHRWAGRPALGCRHEIAVAQIRLADPKLLANAVHCGRATGHRAIAQNMLERADSRMRKRAEAFLARKSDKPDVLRGEVKLEATWDGAEHDIDIALIHPDGHRISWLGAPTKALISATDVMSKEREGLALLGSQAGEYAIEITRASGEGTVRGKLLVRASGQQRTIPFVLQGERLVLGTLRMAWRSRLVRAW